MGGILGMVVHGCASRAGVRVVVVICTRVTPLPPHTFSPTSLISRDTIDFWIMSSDDRLSTSNALGMVGPKPLATSANLLVAHGIMRQRPRRARKRFCCAIWKLKMLLKCKGNTTEDTIQVAMREIARMVKDDAPDSSHLFCNRAASTFRSQCILTPAVPQFISSVQSGTISNFIHL